MLILLLVLAVMILHLTVLGWNYGRGPMRFMIGFRMGFLPGNSGKYHLKHVKPMEQSPLCGKTLCFLGSSVTFGAASLGVSMADYIGKMDQCHIIKEAVSGTTMAGNNSSTYVNRLMKNVDPNANIDIFICQLSTNDATKRLPLGEISSETSLESFDRNTVIGAMEYIIAYVRKTWNCEIVFYTGTKYDSEAYTAMVHALLSLQKKWHIAVIDLWNDAEMNAVSKENYALYMNDPIHPTKAGYLEWWVPKFQKALYELKTG